MNDDWHPPIWPKVPEQYDPAFMEQAFFQIVRALENLKAEGNIRAGTINISDLPTSAAGLRPGDLWNDAGILKVI